MRLNVVIPAHNEEGSIRSSILDIHTTLLRNNISHEILVVNDNSKGRTEDILKDMTHEVRREGFDPPRRNNFKLIIFFRKNKKATI